VTLQKTNMHALVLGHYPIRKREEPPIPAREGTPERR